MSYLSIHYSRMLGWNISSPCVVVIRHVNEPNCASVLGTRVFFYIKYLQIRKSIHYNMRARRYCRWLMNIFFYTCVELAPELAILSLSCSMVSAFHRSSENMLNKFLNILKYTIFVPQNTCKLIHKLTRWELNLT